MLDKDTEAAILAAQRDEITEHFVYEKLAGMVSDTRNRTILKRISEDELEHHRFWERVTHRHVKPSRWKFWKYTLISRILGITFGIKLMERGEAKAQVAYERISRIVPGALDLQKEENEHEKKLTDLIDEERLRYVGSMVLGLNDALVELTGALAGFTFALQNTRLIAMAGLITGIAGSLSMAASEYLSAKSEEGSKVPMKSSLYTGSVYVLTVLFLIFPYLIFSNYYFCLGFTIVNAIVVILFFTYYISIAKNIPFRRRFFEMASVSLGVAALTFVIGFLVRIFLRIEV